MRGREFETLTMAATLYLVSSSLASAEDAPRKDDKPNILFIITDQQHAGMLSCVDNKWLNTPALDSLARNGVRFAHAFSANPVCVPSRTGMATGVMPCRLGATANRAGLRIKLPPEVEANSLGKLMKRAGYDTFYGGKVHMCKALTPENAGYDVYFKDEREHLPAACLNFINKKRAKPFFAVASFINPHDICDEYMAANSKSGRVFSFYNRAALLPGVKLPPLPANYAIQQNEPSAIEAQMNSEATTPVLTMRKQYSEKDWRIYRWIYRRLTEQVDYQIGTILDGLKAAGLDNNTLIIFTSDHGNMDAAHRMASKSFFYEESVGVPLIIKYPGGISAGRVDQTHLVSTGLDILPTICDYAGIPAPKHLLGMSLRPLAEGRNVDNWRTYVASENGFTRMIRSQTWKYCAYNDPRSKESLVDLEKDPGEMQNLADDPKFKDVLLKYRGLLKDWIERSGDKDGSKFLIHQ